MTKKQKYNAEDNRGVAIYARKSRITNKGDSIGVQFKQCEEYAKREMCIRDRPYTQRFHRALEFWKERFSLRSLLS